MKQVTFPRDRCSWDRYKAFHTFCGMFEDGFQSESSYGGPPSLVVLFDTGELIVTAPQPNPNQRGNYNSVGISLTTTKELRLWMPDGTPVVRAWLDDGGIQYLLHDWDSNRVVRLDGPYRRGPSTNYQGKEDPGSPLTPGIPTRFQFECRGYIPGPRLPPISHEKIKLTIPIQKAGYGKDELEHIRMIVATGQAAMKLTDHEALQRAAAVGANPDVLLKCSTWQDVPDAQLPGLAKFGAGPVVRKFYYLLTEEPKGAH